MKRSYNICLVLDLSASPGRNLMHGIARYSRIYGPWQLNNVWVDFYDKTPKSSELLAGLKKNLINSDGVIMREPAAWNYLKDIDIPMIVASAIKDVEVSEIPTIVTNSEAIGKMGAEYFMSKGFKHLAFCGLKGMAWSRHREKHFVASAKNIGLEVSQYSFDYPQDEQSRTVTTNALGQWLKKLPRPVGIMSANDLCGKMILDSCRKYSIVVPDEVAVLGVDDDDIFCELAYPSLSSIALNTEKAGFESAALLDRMIRGRKIGTHKITVEPTVIKERQSTDIIAVQDPIVSQVLFFIQKNVNKPLQVQDVVEEFNISKGCLYAKFRDALGTTVYGEIRRIRVEEMCKMLIETDLSIRDIVFGLGFSEIEHVSRFFKKEKGLSPSQYRTKHR